MCIRDSIWASVCAHFAVNTYSITVVQILKLCKMYDGVINNTAVQSTDIPMTVSYTHLWPYKAAPFDVIYVLLYIRHLYHILE